MSRPNVTRSEFLRGLAATLVTASFAPMVSFGTEAHAEEGGPEVLATRRPLDLATFRALKETVFRLRRGGDALGNELILKNVVELQFGKGTVKSPQIIQTEQFSLEFQSPDGIVLPAGTYTFEHAKLGTVLLYISPSRTEAKGRLTYYRADLNLLK